MYERFTDRARKVFQQAIQEAIRFNHEHVGTEHILLGLLKEDSGVAAFVLKELDLDLHRIRLEIERLVQTGPDMVNLAKPPQTPRTKKVIENSMEESRKLKHGYVGTEHLLLGLMREQEGVAGAVLANFGLTVDGVRAKILEVLNRPFGWDRKQYTHWPIKQPLEERLGINNDLPKSCPKCGQERIVRVLWHWVHLCGKNQEDLASGKAILASQSYDAGPPWVCLQCEPRWSEVHRLALQEREGQAAKEKAIASQDFDLAVKYRDTQVDLRRQVDLLIAELLRNR